MKPRMLMCAPDHFGVRYVINPWMEDQIDHIDTDRARAQWEAFYQALSEQAEVHLIEPRRESPDMVFTANAGLLVDGIFVLSRFRHKERQGEEPFFLKWFQQYESEIVKLADGIAFEGEGDALPQPGQDWIWAGWGFRTDLASQRFIEQKVGRPMVSLHLVDPRFYHLDTCFCPLPSDRVMYFPKAFDADSLRQIEARIAPENRIAVSREDAEHFACNAARVHNTLFMNHATPALRRRLNSLGFSVVTCPVDEFMKAGGANKCLTLVLDAGDPAGALPQNAEQAASPR